jgi:hypothetical protein
MIQAASPLVNTGLSVRENAEQYARDVLGLNEFWAFEYGWAVAKAVTLGADMTGYKFRDGKPAIKERTQEVEVDGQIKTVKTKTLIGRRGK